MAGSVRNDNRRPTLGRDAIGFDVDRFSRRSAFPMATRSIMPVIFD
jgi:hypothetical protein